MRTGEPRRPGAQRGYSYLGVLFLVTLTAAGLAALGQTWRTAAQREKERELMFRGGEIARAIASYQRATPQPPAQSPQSLDDLLLDRRATLPRHHLRKVYVDPFTRAADWELVTDPAQPGRFHAVRSRSDQLLLMAHGPDGEPVRRAQDLLFSAQAADRRLVHQADAASAPAAASTASP